MSALLVTLLLLQTMAPAQAEVPIEQVRDAELERVRAELANQVQLSAYDLVDELVYGWLAEPVFQSPTPVVLAEVTVPVGLGTGLQAQLENHLGMVLIQNPATNVQLVHCPSCTAVVVHSGPEGTVMSRGIDNPSVLEDLGAASGQHALFIDVEAEGTWLVLRARLTRLTPDLPIVWSHTISTSASTPALLRQSEELKSAEDTRAEYVAMLEGRSPVRVPVRVGLRTYAPANGPNAGVAPPPFLWLQGGVELAVSPSEVWVPSFMVGYAVIPDAYQGLMGQVRANRLLTGRYRSLTRPDLYGFAGVSVMSVWGPATASFRDETLTADAILTDGTGASPRASIAAMHFGLELRVGPRIRASSFLETMPGLNNSNNFGQYAALANLRFQSWGVEVTFCF